MLLAVVALLLYGGNLPEVARSWGKTFSEFRRGLTGFQSEMNNVIYDEPEKIAYRDDSRNPHGYEESDSSQEGPDKEQDESDATIRDAVADTIAIDAAEDLDGDLGTKPTD